MNPGLTRITGVVEEEKEWTMEGGIVVPPVNPLGHNCRAYDNERERQAVVDNFYRTNHMNQTYDLVKRMREEYCELDRAEMSIWECCKLLNNVVDESDPDIGEPQSEHLLQAAESIRKDNPKEDWLPLTGPIHDLGKVLGAPPVGCRRGHVPVSCSFTESIMHHKYFDENPDSSNPEYNTKYGVYSKGCGLHNVMMSWGHDNYMHMVARDNKTSLPFAALFIIRYHSFYALNRARAYCHLTNEENVENLKWLQIFEYRISAWIDPGLSLAFLWRSRLMDPFALCGVANTIFSARARSVRGEGLALLHLPY